MRNDAHDEINDLPSLSAVCTETTDQSATVAAAEPLTENQAQINTPVSSSSKAVGILSAVSFALVCASASFVWWSMQRMQLLEQQLVATQDSFSRISEDAEGRIKAISGQFTATESSVLGDNERLKMRLNKIESAAVETAKQQQISTAAHAAQLTKISNELSTLVDALAVMKKHNEQQQQVLEQQKNTLSTVQQELRTGLASYQQQLTDLQKTSTQHQQHFAQLSEQEKKLAHLATQLAALQKNTVTSADLTRLQQDMLILRSELEQRSSTTSSAHNGPSLADFDAYRAQTNRTISALQEQVRHLQKNAP
ncbi:MAG: hypothetical protein GXX06_06290 [Gammaproteobacteria bacterium]|nr:hypothetical protein [Gammaproteobacteria bacterium]